MTFIQENAFKQPDFWINQDVLQRVGYDFYLDTVLSFGTRQIDRLTAPKLVDRLVKFQAAGLEVYSPITLMDDLRTSLFEEANWPKISVSAYRLHLQSHFVNLLISGLEAPSSGDDAVSEVFRSLARGVLISLETDLGKVANNRTMTQIHFQSLEAKITKALDVD